MTDPNTPTVVSTTSSINSEPPKAPGIRRLAFAGSFVAFIIIGALLNVATNSALGGLIAVLFLMFPASKRLANIGRHPMWCLLLLVPILGLFVTIPCLILPESHQYHRKLDLAAKISVGVLFALFAVAIIAIFF